jgi:hypothetical protein
MTARYPRPARSSTPIPAVNSPAPFPVDVYEAAQDACKAYAGGVKHGGGIPGVARKMGIPEGTLYNKLTPHESSPHRLTVQDLIQITVATGNLGALNALAQTLDCVCFPVPDYHGLADTELLDLLSRVHVEEGEFHSVLRHALADGRIDPTELAQLRKEAYEWIGAIAEAHARLEAICHA